MKKNKSLIKTQRKSLDLKLRAFSKALSMTPPKSGWIRAVRESIGMTTVQLAKRMGIQQSGATLLENRELTKKVSLDILQRAAHAMNCELVYAIVPKESLEQVVDLQAQKAAKKILQRTTHTMELEQQGAGVAETNLHLEELVMELKNNLDRRLWEIK